MIPHRPSPAQWEFLALSCEEALFGGAAGGGKSDALIMAALQFADVPGYSAAIFRRTQVEQTASDAPLARALQWFGPALGDGRAWFDADSSTFFFRTREGQPPSALHFGYLRGDADRGRYQGAAFQFLGIDELGFWNENTYRWLFSRLRGPREWRGVVPNRMRATANPGGPGHRWIKARFVEQARHVATGTEVRADLVRRRNGGVLPEPRVYVSPPSPDAVELAAELGTKAEGAHFVPAFAVDNPGLDFADYRRKLVRLSPVEREWFEHGNWDAEPTGGFFRPEHFEVVDVLPPVAAWVRGWDFAATAPKPGTDPDYTAGVKVGRLDDVGPVPAGEQRGVRLVIGNVERWRDEPGPTEARVVAIARADGRSTLHVLEQEPGAAGKAQRHAWATRSLAGHRLDFERRSGPKASYWQPISSLAHHAPLLVLRAPWTQAFLDELTSLPVGHDDQADALGIAAPRVIRPSLFLL